MLTPDAHRSDDVRVSEVLAGLSYALDLTEGQRPGHAVRSCVIGMRLADEIGLADDQRTSLFYALLMKDLGCSSNAARFAALFAADDHQLKADLKTIDWSRALTSFRYVATSVAPGQSWPRRVWRALAVFARGPEGAREVVRTRCERGADIAKLLRFSDDTVQAIRTIDEHWDGHGQPYELKGQAIPLLGRIVGFAQTVEVFLSTYGPQTAYDMAVVRRGRWFDPALVDALLSMRTDTAFWQDFGRGHELARIAALEPPDRVLGGDEAYLDLVAEAFAKVIDAKSPWTYRHSTGVADIATSIGRKIGYGPEELRDLRRAALLHDVGKLAVSNLILDKPGKLTDAEMTIVRNHPGHTWEILNRVGCFRHLTEIAASHHERLDGNGYHRRIGSGALSTAARVLCTADICDALLATRPYRPGLAPERVMEIMGREIDVAIDRECFEALGAVLTADVNDRADQAPAVEVVRALAEDYHQAA
jgi:putative nucleotidyltransferase with HDIG domain